MNPIVVIPSATLVPEELRKLGELPAIIYPFEQKIVFDYLWEQYCANCSLIKIICFMNAEVVHRQLEVYCNEKLIIEDLPELKDLGHTVYYGIRNIFNPIIINFADTILLDEQIPNVKDFIFYSEDKISDRWTYIEEANGVIKNVVDKKYVSYQEMETGKLVVGVFGVSNVPYFSRCLELAFEIKDQDMSTFYYALKLYSEKYPMRAIETNNWFDIGHVDRYYNSRLEVKTREFNHIYMDKNRGLLRKSSDDVDKFICEIKWYLKLPSDIEYVRPRIFDYSISYTSPFILMEYYAYHTIHELYLYSDLSRKQWEDIFKRIKFVCNDFERYRVSDVRIKLALKEMYLTKTIERLNKIKEDVHFINFFNNNIEINNIKYKSLNSIENILITIIPQMLYDVEEFCIIHGDLCFANIMVDDNFSFIKIVDPRGKFGQYDIYGDSRYELAKLFHSIDGKYDYIIKDMFTVEYELSTPSIHFKIIERKRDFNLYEIFIDAFKEKIGTDIKKIELIESLLFLSMIPLHRESFKHQMVMLGTGIEILNRVVDITD